MKIKCFYAISCFVSLIVLASCDNDSKTTEIKTADSLANASIPVELKELNKQLLADPKNPDLYHKRAQYYYNTKNFEAGLADMAHVMKIDSSKAEYFLTLSDLYFVTNKTRNAKAALEKCVAIDNKNIDAILKLAELYLYLNKHDKSIECINNALKLDQYNSKAYFMKGMNYKELKDTAKAISSMQTAVEQDKEYYNAYMQLGILCAAKKNNLASQYYKNAIRIQPRSIEAWYDLGKYYQDVSDLSNAVGTYMSLLQFAPGNKFAHYNLGVIYLIGLKKNDIAVQHFTDAITIDPKYVEAYYGRGITYQTMKDVKKAVVDFRACLAIDPQYQSAEIALKKLNGK